MRKLVFVFILFLVSCKEKNDMIIYTNQLPADDTTYKTKVENVQERNVLIEEFTGGNCSNCPKGANVVHGLQTQYGDRIVAMGIHIFGLGLGEPAKNAKFDFRTQDGTDISKVIFGSVFNLPLAGIDRIPGQNDKITFPWPDWAGTVTGRLNVAPTANLNMKTTLDNSTNEITIRIKLAYTQEISFKHNLVIALLENDVKDVQLNGLVIDSAYNFKHILRDLISPATGFPVLEDMPVKEPGRVYERTLTYKLDPAWKADKCEVIAFITRNDGVNKEIMQAVKTEL